MCIQISTSHINFTKIHFGSFHSVSLRSMSCVFSFSLKLYILFFFFALLSVLSARLSTVLSNHIFIGLHNFTYALRKMCVFPNIFYPHASIRTSTSYQEFCKILFGIRFFRLFFLFVVRWLKRLGVLFPFQKIYKKPIYIMFM